MIESCETALLRNVALSALLVVKSWPCAAVATKIVSAQKTNVFIGASSVIFDPGYL